MRDTSAFEIVDSPNGDARVRVQGRSYSPPELSGIVLQRLKAAQAALTPRVQELREADDWRRFANVAIQEQLCAFLLDACDGSLQSRHCSYTLYNVGCYRLSRAST